MDWAGGASSLLKTLCTDATAVWKWFIKTAVAETGVLISVYWRQGYDEGVSSLCALVSRCDSLKNPAGIVSSSSRSVTSSSSR